ncbi:Segregation and condensation protein A [Streptomyces sp. enrichment culture]
MTSNDAPRPGRTPRAGRRRALGRGPGAPAAAPLTAQTPSGDGASGTAGAAPAEQDLRAGPAPAGPAVASAADPGDPARIHEMAAPDAEEYHPGTPGAAAPEAGPDPTGHAGATGVESAEQGLRGGASAGTSDAGATGTEPDATGPGVPSVAEPPDTGTGTEEAAIGRAPVEAGRQGAARADQPVRAGGPPDAAPATDPPPGPGQSPRAADHDGLAPVERPVSATGAVAAADACAAPAAPGAPGGVGPEPGVGPRGSVPPTGGEPAVGGPQDAPRVGGEEASGAHAEEGSGRHGAASSQKPSEDIIDEAGDGVFKVRLANFEGPFDLLLQLISKHKMDVTEVALSKVTDEFMAHIRAMGPDWDLDQTTEFLVVAATLLDLKAARLLPAAEVEDEADLALLEARDLLFARLLQYRAYKQIAEIFNDRLAAEARRYPRTVGLEVHHAELLPEVVISIGPEGFAKLAVKAMQPKPKPQVYVEHIHAPLVSVQEQAGIVVARLRELGEASFRVLVRDTEDTLTVVARFLALLELYREKAVELDQETALGDLLVRWTGGDGETQPVVTDEFDRPPETPKEEQKA